MPSKSPILSICLREACPETDGVLKRQFIDETPPRNGIFNDVEKANTWNERIVSTEKKTKVKQPNRICPGGYCNSYSMRELGPTEINTERASHLVKVHKGKLSFQYTGKGNHVHDVGSVQANRPFAVNELIGYFELRITCAGQRGNIAIGLTNPDFNVMRHPGKDAGSYGYQGDDGKKFEDNGQGEPYGPKFGVEDIIGCGLHFGTREIFFTKNGQHLGVAFRGISHAYFPTVGLHSEGESATLNFGVQPFMFPIATLIREEESKFSNSISRLHVEGASLHEIVRQYLQHHGHFRTLEFLPAVGPAPDHEQSSGVYGISEDPSSCDGGGVEHSSKCQATCRLLRQLVREARTSEAIQMLDSAYPSFLKECAMARAVLLSQVMVERLARGDLAGAVAFARESLAPLLAGPANRGDEAMRDRAEDDGGAGGLADGADEAAEGEDGTDERGGDDSYRTEAVEYVRY